jgi:uncharacterized protein
MIFVLSPAKSLDFETPLSLSTYTQPTSLEYSQALISILKEKNGQDLESLMGISPALGELNAARFRDWHLPFTPNNARQAALAFNGDVYEGLDAKTLPESAWRYTQEHLCILSGLYGVLKPLDLIQPYRLEMGTRLPNPKGKDLYAFWGNHITDRLNQTIRQTQAKALFNLASEEYFKAVKKKNLTVPIITPIFEDWKNDQYKMISFYAKRARGLMARYCSIHQLHDVQDARSFNLEGYAYTSEASTEDRWVFRRRIN